jgi:hypothetical protein
LYVLGAPEFPEISRARERRDLGDAAAGLLRRRPRRQPEGGEALGRLVRDVVWCEEFGLERRIFGPRRSTPELESEGRLT